MTLGKACPRSPHGTDSLTESAKNRQKHSSCQCLPGGGPQEGGSCSLWSCCLKFTPVLAQRVSWLDDFDGGSSGDCIAWNPNTRKKKVPSKRVSGPSSVPQVQGREVPSPRCLSWALTCRPVCRYSLLVALYPVSLNPGVPFLRPRVAICPPPRLGSLKGQRFALPRDRSAAVTRTVGPEQRSVRWAVAVLNLEGQPQ